MPDIDKVLVKALQMAMNKPQNFVAIAKGSSIAKLLVDRRPIPQGAVKAAKDECHGNTIIKGVVSCGPNRELVFAVNAKPAVADDKLRKYINDEARLAVKARFEVVAQTPEVDDQEEAAAAPAKSGKSPTQAVVAMPAAGGTAAAAGGADPATAFNARLKALLPDIQQAVAAGGDAGLEIKLASSEAGVMAHKMDFAAANRLLDRAQTLLKAAVPSAAGSVPPPPPPPPAPPALPPERSLAAAIRHVESDFRQSLRAFPERKAELEKAWAVIQQQVQDKNIAGAKAKLEELRRVLAALGSVSLDQAAEFREQWDAAVESWEDAVAAVSEQMEDLKSALADSEDEDLAAIAEFGLGAVTQEHLVPLRAAILELGATPPDRLKVVGKRVQNQLAAFRQHIESSRAVAACDENPFGVTVTIRQSLAPGLTALERGLGALAVK